MKISVIIPVYNVGDYIVRAVSSLENQKFDDFEVLLVNDGSTDNSQEICEQLERRYDNVTLINQENQGSGYARNAGLDRAKGDYIYFADPDDYLTGEFFKAVEANTTQQEDMVVFGYIDEYESKGQIEEQRIQHVMENYLKKNAFRQKFPQLFNEGALYTLWNKVYRRDFLEAHHIRFTNAPMGQDVRFNYDVYAEVKTVRFVDHAYYHYVINRADSSTNRYRSNRLKLQLEELALLEKLIQSFEISGDSMLLNEKSRFLKGNVNHVVLSNLPREKRYSLMREIVDQPAFEDVFENNPYLDAVTRDLLANHHFPLYDLLFRTANRNRWIYRTLKSYRSRHVIS